MKMRQDKGDLKKKKKKTKRGWEWCVLKAVTAIAASVA